MNSKWLCEICKNFLSKLHLPVKLRKFFEVPQKNYLYMLRGIGFVFRWYVFKFKKIDGVSY